MSAYWTWASGMFFPSRGLDPRQWVYASMWTEDITDSPDLPARSVQDMALDSQCRHGYTHDLHHRGT